ncbi:TetR/AcrR family transcriptional regulator [Streptomyces sp. SBT349]|uniref:TetR/AcrR family transcriptional regulator n=1 Tax=Streptomyces sp. SBT349 TaxID=1580539 RepID=UPI00066E52CA|nr:TetR/AcrR family transcriptional regulator [Streptomyces sp. SBT349]
MSSPAPSAPGTLARTRRAILDAAIRVFAEDRAAPLGEVAKAAGVGRSTLHRYFPDRAALVRGLLDDCTETIEQALAEAALDQGPLSESFRRLLRAFFDVGPRVDFLFNEPLLSAEDWTSPSWEAAHLPAAILFERGKAEGFFAPEMDVEWFFRILWYMMAAGWEAVSEGALARHEALARVTQTMEGGLLAHRR